MKKYIATLLILAAAALSSRAQITDTPMRVVLDDSGIPVEAADYLYNRLLYLTTGASTGVAAGGASQFLISAKTIVESKEAVASTPAMYSLSLDVVLYIADWLNDRLYTRVSLSCKGAGQSETKAYINAFRRINASDSEIKAFLESGREAIINYYNSNGEAILQSARLLSAQRQYEKALFTLACIPSACDALYWRAQEEILSVYADYVDYDGQMKLSEARNTWASTQNRTGAVKACSLLSQIDPASSSYADAAALSKEIQDQMGRISEMKVYEDNVDLEKQKLEAARQIGVAYGSNQQPTTSNFIVR